MADVFFIAIVVAVVIAIPIALFMFLSRVWKFGWIGKCISIGVGGLILFSVITGIWPEDAFYIDEFESHTGLALPKSAIVVDKEASYPDVHGDYSSEAVIQLNPADFNALRTTASQITAAKCSISAMAKTHLGKEIVPIGCSSTEKTANGYEYFEWTMFSDNKTIYFEFWSS